MCLLGELVDAVTTGSRFGSLENHFDFRICLASACVVFATLCCVERDRYPAGAGKYDEMTMYGVSEQ